MSTLHILMEFSMIFDTDVGIIRYLKKNNMLNSDVFKNEYITCGDEQLIKHICESKFSNPIAECIKNEHMQSASNLFNELMNDDDSYNGIISNSIITDLFGFITTAFKTPDDVLKITVLCDNQKQVDLINSYETIKGIKTIIPEDMNKINIDDYGTIYVKNISSIYKYDNINGKNIYIPNMGYNMEEITPGIKLPLQFITNVICKSNNLTVISLYNKLKID